MVWIKLDIDKDESAEFEREYKKKGRFLVDESLGREVANIIKSVGWNARYVGDVGLTGHSDEDICAFAWRGKRILLTHDHDLLDNRRFPPHRNPGIVVLPGASGETETLERELARVLYTLGEFADAYRKLKIRIREDGTWAIQDPSST